MDYDEKNSIQQIRDADNHMSSTIMYVSTGAFALSITYYIDVYFTTLEVWLMIIGWFCLIMSVISGVISSFFVREAAYKFLISCSKMTEKQNKSYTKKVDVSDRLSLGLFIVGVLILSLTIMINVVLHNVIDNEEFKENNTPTNVTTNQSL